MYKKETLQQMEAFEFYYVSGKDRSQEKVAEEYKIALRTVARWSADFGWQDRIILRNKVIGEKLAEATDTAIINEKSKLINITKASIARYVEAEQMTGPRKEKPMTNQLSTKVQATRVLR